jgi:hypothetical protein
MLFSSTKKQSTQAAAGTKTHLLQLPDFICALAGLPFKSVRLILVHCTSVNSVQQLLTLLLELVCRDNSS